MDKGNLQNLSKIDIEAEAQTSLKQLNLFPDRTKKFKADCCDIIQLFWNLLKTHLLGTILSDFHLLLCQNILLKIERNILTNSWLSASKKISCSVAGKAKFHYNEIQTLGHEAHYYTEFSEFNYQNECLDVFLGKYFSGSKELWHVSKLVFVLLHGQSFI